MVAQALSTMRKIGGRFSEKIMLRLKMYGQLLRRAVLPLSSLEGAIDAPA